MNLKLKRFDAETVKGQKISKKQTSLMKHAWLFFFAILTLCFALGQSVSAQITIHVLHPWASNPVLGKKTLHLQCSESWYPGVVMISECNNWYSYTLASASRTSNDHFNFAIDTGNSGNNYINCPAAGGQQLIYATIFSTAPSNADEVWIVFSSLTQPPTFSFKPPTKAKVLHILNPWDLGVPRVQILSKGGINQFMKADSGKCGWFRYEYFGCLDDIQVRFMNSVDSSLCGMNGKGDSTYINLTATFSKTDSVWITMPSSAGQTVAIQSAFPGTLKDCSDIYLAADMHDIGVHPDVDRWDALGSSCQGVQKGMVEKKLGSDGLPVKRQTTCPLATQFDWFTTKILSAPYTNETCYNLRLRKNEEGFYYADDSLFYPIDDFKYLDPAGTITNPNNSMMSTDPAAYKEHNNHFTMIVSASFEYTKGQTFYFRGDDDVWVFIDSQLVVDLGGIHPPADGSVKLDTLGLTPGKTYDFKLFYTERNCCGSSFKMVTSLNLRTNSSFFMTTTQINPGVLRYDMFEKITKHNLGCSFGDTVIKTQPAVVDFSISGPSIPTPTPLPADTSYGGIIINGGNNSLLIDTSIIRGLDPGVYTITYTLRSDPTQHGTVMFTIKSLPPHHYDILTDSMVLDKKKDATVDSIVIGMLDSTAQIYAVIRDSTGLYIKYASNPTWTSRNPLAASVTQSPTDPSRCIITKTGAGVSWVVVSDPAGKLKSDSVKIVTYVRPIYPIILSAIMLDNNADLVPDMLRIALTDTFKTGQRLDSVQIDYRGRRITVPGGSIVRQGTLLQIPVPATVGIDGRPTGTATIYMTVGAETKTNAKAFTDGVCPALIAADVLENDGTQPDVLYLTFSEPVSPGSVNGKQLLLIKANTIDTLFITQVLRQTNDSTFTVQTATTDRKALAGDSLRLVPGSWGGGIVDISQNKPHDLNRPVVVGLRPGAAAVLGTWYRDVNADGIVDEIVLRFKRHVLPGELSPVIVGWGSHQFTADPANARQVNDSTIAIPFSGVTDISTGGPMDLLVGYTAVPDVHRIFSAADSAAPVLISARLVAGAIVSGTQQGIDSLVVRFSESVRDPGARPFWLSSRAGGVRYQFALGPRLLTNEWCRSVVGSIVPSGAAGAIRAGDTVWIDTAARVTDSSGVVQLNPQNRRVLLEVTWPKQTWQISLSSNPFTPLVTPIPPGYSAGGMAYGTVIILRPTSPVDLEHTRGTIVIYDPLGNTVTNAPLQSINGRYCYPWSGANQQGRLVGTGAYLGVVRVFDNDRAAYSNKIKIGVKR